MAIFKKQYTKPLPRGAEVFTRDGQRYARWADRNGRTRTAKVTAGRDGSTRIMLETRTLTVRIREASGVIRQVSSGCRTRSAAEGVLAGLRKRRERIKAGVVTQEEETASGHAVNLHFVCHRNHQKRTEKSSHLYIKNEKNTKKRKNEKPPKNATNKDRKRTRLFLGAPYPGCTTLVSCTKRSSVGDSGICGHYS